MDLEDGEAGHEACDDGNDCTVDQCDPAQAKDGRYLLPHAPGYGVAMKPDSVAAFSWPEGKEWKARGEG